MKFKKKKEKPLNINDITIIDDGKLKKAITAASLGNAMEWFDFGVYFSTKHRCASLWYARR